MKLEVAFEQFSQLQMMNNRWTISTIKQGMCRGEYWNMTAFHDSLAHVMFWKFLQLKEPWASEMLKPFKTWWVTVNHNIHKHFMLFIYSICYKTTLSLFHVCPSCSFLKTLFNRMENVCAFFTLQWPFYIQNNCDWQTKLN